MVRGKIQMKKIENAAHRQVTFSKRRSGVLKKAYELSVLCDAEVAVIVFSQRGRLYEFSSSDMQKIIERYCKSAKEVQVSKVADEQQVQKLRNDSAIVSKQIQTLQLAQWKLLGHGLESCSYDELQDIDGQLERSLQRIRMRKSELFAEQVIQLKEKENELLQENGRLKQQQISTSNNHAAKCSPNGQSSDIVDTQLFIGLREVAVDTCR